MDFHCHVITDVNLTRANKIETLYGMSGVYVKVEPRVAFHALPLFHLRTSILRALIARKNYAKVEINPFAPKGDAVKILTPGVLSIKTREL